MCKGGIARARGLEAPKNGPYVRFARDIPGVHRADQEPDGRGDMGGRASASPGCAAGEGAGNRRAAMPADRWNRRRADGRSRVAAQGHQPDRRRIQQHRHCRGDQARYPRGLHAGGPDADDGRRDVGPDAGRFPSDHGGRAGRPRRPVADVAPAPTSWARTCTARRWGSSAWGGLGWRWRSAVWGST